MDRMRNYELARRKVKKRQGFYANLFSYILVIIFLFVINILTSSFPWVLFPAAGWGLGLLFHALSAFDFPGFSKEWEQRKIREEMIRMEEEEEALRWEIREQMKGKDPQRSLPEGNIDELDLERLREVQKRYRDEDLV